MCLRDGTCSRVLCVCVCNMYTCVYVVFVWIYMCVHTCICMYMFVHFVCDRVYVCLPLHWWLSENSLKSLQNMIAVWRLSMTLHAVCSQGGGIAQIKFSNSYLESQCSHWQTLWPWAKSFSPLWILVYSSLKHRGWTLWSLWLSWEAKRYDSQCVNYWGLLWSSLHLLLFKAAINKNNLCSKIRIFSNLLEVDENSLQRVITWFDLGTRLKHSKQSLFTISLSTSLVQKQITKETHYSV